MKIWPVVREIVFVIMGCSIAYLAVRTVAYYNRLQSVADQYACVQSYNILCAAELEKVKW